MSKRSGRDILRELPLEQILTLAQLAEEHPDSTWHLNDCGCCVCFHPGGNTTMGFIVPPDGDAEFVSMFNHPN